MYGGSAVCPQAQVPTDLQDDRQADDRRRFDQRGCVGFPQCLESDRTNGPALGCLHRLLDSRACQTSLADVVQLPPLRYELCLPAILEGNQQDSQGDEDPGQATRRPADKDQLLSTRL